MIGMTELSPGPSVASAAGEAIGHAPMVGMDTGPGVLVLSGPKAAFMLLTMLMLAVGY